MSHMAYARALLAHLPQAGALLDRKGHILAVNDSFCSFCLADSFSLCGKLVSDLLSPQGPSWRSLLRLHPGESVDLVCAHGSGPGVRSVDFCLAMLDTQQERAEPVLLLKTRSSTAAHPNDTVDTPEESLRLDRRYQAFFDLAPLGMFVSSSSGRFMEVNKSLATMLGYDSPHEVVEQVQDIAQDIYVYPERRLEIVEIIRRSPWFAQFENDYRRRNGSSFTASLYVTVLDEMEGVGSCLLGVVEDITKRKRDEEALRLSREKFESIFDNAPIGIYQSTLEGRYISVNPEFASMFGFSSPEEVLQEVEDIGETLYMDSRCRIKMIAELLDKGAVTNFEARSRRKDGCVFWTSRNVRLMRDLEGRPLHLKGFVTDISQQKELEQLREDVERITRHDIKSPILSCILGVRMLQKESNLTPRQVELLQEMEKSGQRMLAMINLSLDLYKMERGTYELEPTALNILPVIYEEGQAALKTQGYKKLRLKVSIDGRTPGNEESFQIFGEELLLRSLFMNLLLNAAEASPEGCAVSVALERGSHDARIAIHNHGAVPEQIRNKLFEKYITCGKRHGTGLGTYSARLIAQTHKGGIACESSAQQGTTIRLSLPLPPA